MSECILLPSADLQAVQAVIPRRFLIVCMQRDRDHVLKERIGESLCGRMNGPAVGQDGRKGDSMKYLSGLYWDAGTVAGKNQDSAVLQQVLTARGRVLLAAVCDGMGGLEQGEWASGYVTQRLQEWFYESLLWAIRKRKPCWVVRRSMERLVYHMQEKIRQYGLQEEIDLGTTMTVLVLYEKTYLAWHLGDSRLYRIWDGHRETRIRCETQDHVMGTNRLTKCVGSFGYERPDFRTGTIGNGQAMLLCSDGFYHHITQQELADILDPGRLWEEAQIPRRLREIGEACKKRGERDNLSAVYVKAGNR